MIRHEEIRYWKEQFGQAGNDKQFCKIVRKAQGKDKKHQIPPIDDGSGKILVDDLDKAKCLNKCFSNIGQELFKKFQDSVVDTNQNFYRITPSCSQIKLSEEQLVHKLKHVKVKSGGTDNISSQELAEAGEALSEGLFGIFKNSIKDSVHPEIWKVGIVIPAFKKGIKSDRRNYRSLTMLNLNSKLLGSVVCDSLDNHPSEEEILHPNQWGFEKGISTESLLLNLSKKWKKAPDHGYKIGIIFVDFKKAFNTVEHTVLKSKLLAAGISGKFHDWLISYISDRSQYVLINGRRSGLQIVDIGVLQGSLLGPRLFAVHVNNLPNATLIGYIHMFADDTTMNYCGKEVEEIVDILNMMLLDLHQWCVRNNSLSTQEKLTPF